MSGVPVLSGAFPICPHPVTSQRPSEPSAHCTPTPRTREGSRLSSWGSSAFPSVPPTTPGFSDGAWRGGPIGWLSLPVCAHTHTHTHTHVCSAPKLVPSRPCFWAHENDSLRKDGSPELPPHLLLEQKYLTEGLVGVGVAEAEWGFLPEPLSELMLLELREDHVRRSGPPPQGPAMVGAAARPPPPRQATIPQTAGTSASGC